MGRTGIFRQPLSAVIQEAYEVRKRTSRAVEQLRNGETEKFSSPTAGKKASTFFLTASKCYIVWGHDPASGRREKGGPQEDSLDLNCVQS